MYSQFMAKQTGWVEKAIVRILQVNLYFTVRTYIFTLQYNLTTRESDLTHDGRYNTVFNSEMRCVAYHLRAS